MSFEKPTHLDELFNRRYRRLVDENPCIFGDPPTGNDPFCVCDGCDTLWRKLRIHRLFRNTQGVIERVVWAVQSWWFRITHKY